ncbi:hypothetical protein QAD02_010774 [Eretmocerus hayati]|uniref:Uncharacterized protein n=1 Tax=Eretmocerus hayati TaxID=131215 RepID=A0ACC2NVV3_9HYME|nr:hypothetical protein QAD02_010774 [Eretmocerus hayati]
MSLARWKRVSCLQYQLQNELGVHEGDLWRYEWVRVDEEWVRVIVPGPFADSAAALLTPIPAPNCHCSSSTKRKSSTRRRRRNSRRPENGIPEPWIKELLREEVQSGFHEDESDERVGGTRAGPQLERNHERLTRYLWLQRGLALAQGIPDPWKQTADCSCHKEDRKKKKACFSKNQTSSSLKIKGPKTGKSKSNKLGHKSIQPNSIECRRASFDRMRQHLSELEADLLQKQTDLEKRCERKNAKTPGGRKNKKTNDVHINQTKVELLTIGTCDETTENPVCVKQEPKSTTEIAEVRVVEKKPTTPSQIPKMIKRSRDSCVKSKLSEVKIDVSKSKTKTRTRSNCGQTSTSKSHQSYQSHRKSGPIPGYKCGSLCNGGRWSGCPCGASNPNSSTPRRLLGQIDSRIKITRDALETDLSERPLADSRLTAGTVTEPKTELLFQRSRSKALSGVNKVKKLEVQRAEKSRLRGGWVDDFEVENNCLFSSIEVKNIMSNPRYIESDTINQDLLIEMSEALLSVKFCGLLITVCVLMGIFNILMCIFILYTISDRDRVYNLERKCEIEKIERKIKVLEDNHRDESKLWAKEEEEVRSEWKRKLEEIEKEIQAIKNDKLMHLTKLFTEENKKRGEEILELKTNFDQIMKHEASSLERKILRVELFVSQMKELADHHRNNSMASYLDGIKAMDLEN